MSVESLPRIGITMGDPAGIGPEIVVKALADPAIRQQARFVVFGMNELLAYAADLAEIEPFWWRVQHDAPLGDACRTGQPVMVYDYDEFSLLGQAVHQPTREGGRASLQFLADAADAAGLPSDHPGRVDAIVTAPISKTSWKKAGCRWPGHTEYLQNRTGSKRSVMMFASPQLRVTLATIHLPLMDLRNVLSIGKVFDAIDLGHHACRLLGIARPRLGVCGLNPHASEDGLFGCEEQRVIAPAIQMARELDMQIHGPLPSDTIYQQALDGRFDLIVAMYHDQGLIPIKLLAFETAVNVTLGLPIIRTSVDHGTAFNIVGKNLANPEPMKSAIRLAVDMARHRRQVILG